MEIEDVLDQYQDQWMATPGVVGVGVGASGSRPVLVVMVTELSPQIKAAIPRRVKGYQVRLEVTGEIIAF